VLGVILDVDDERAARSHRIGVQHISSEDSAKKSRRSLQQIAATSSFLCRW
jgi:hypothetical protein